MRAEYVALSEPSICSRPAPFGSTTEPRIWIDMSRPGRAGVLAGLNRLADLRANPGPSLGRPPACQCTWPTWNTG
jgi:hypothetical protein